MKDNSWQDALTPLGRISVQAGTIPVITRRERTILRRSAAVTLVLGSWMVPAWTLMITAGIAHHLWWPLLPPMSYGAAAAITFWPWAVSNAVVLGRQYFGR